MPGQMNSIYAPIPLSVENGGTSNSTPLNDGELWIGNGDLIPAVPSIARLTPGKGTTITNAPGSITIQSALPTVLSNSAQLQPFKIYLSTGSGTFTIPPSPSTGDQYIVSASGGDPFSITAASGQLIKYLDSSGTVITSDNLGANTAASITIICSVSTPGNTKLNVLSTNGAGFTVT